MPTTDLDIQLLPPDSQLSVSSSQMDSQCAKVASNSSSKANTTYWPHACMYQVTVTRYNRSSHIDDGYNFELVECIKYINKHFYS